MLTISQVASATGLTVRAVRHYHVRGLLPEPPRDHSGYRRYGARDVITLMRIKTLASAGVPLARVRSLLEAGPDDYHEGLAAVDDQLRQRLAELRRHRRDLAQLDDPERLCLPADAIGVMDRLRAIGLSERTLHHFRDGWILVAAVSPGLLTEAVEWTEQQLDHPTYRRLLCRVDEAAEWSPDDPRLVELAAEVVALDEEFGAGDEDEEESHPLLTSFNAAGSPAWGRLDEVIGELDRRRRTAP